MCVGIPMKIIEQGLGVAICESRNERRNIDTMLVGEQPVGTWVLVFIDAAREVLAEEDALKITNALEALEKVMAGESDIDHLFADLIDVNKSSNL